MAFRLPRLPKDLSLVNAMGRASVEFQRWWQSAMIGVENLLLDLQEAIDRITTNETDIAALQAVEFTAGDGLTGGGNILTSPTFAVGAGAGILVAADTVSVSAKLQAYDGGDTPSAFTLGIVDSADAAAWRTAIGAGTSSTTGTVTSVEATVPTGFSIAGSPITTNGTLAITYTAGYQGYTTAEATKLAGVATGATANTGTVTSVGASGGTTGYSFTGGPVTTSGTLTLTGTPSALGTPTTGTLTNCTGLPISTGVAGLGANVATFLATPSSTNLAAAVTGETGTGGVVFATQPQFTSTIGVGTAASASGSGVSFPATQSASTDPNTLDDYEEGAWAPSVSASSGTITTLGTVTGTYTKIGREVTVRARIAITTNGTGAGAINVAGLPFNPGADSDGSGRERTLTGTQLQAVITSGSGTMNIMTYSNAYPGASGCLLTVTATYQV